MPNAFQGISKIQKNYVGKIKSTPPYLTCNSIDENLQFFYFLCSNLLRLRLLLEQMHQIPKNMLQFSAIPFGRTKIKVLNIRVNPPHLVLKSTNRRAQVFSTFKLQTFLFEFLI